MDNCRRKGIIVLLLVCISFHVHAQEFYNSLVDDLLNACSYGYKGVDLDTGEINFANISNDSGYVYTLNENAFYIPSYKGFFMVENSNGEIFYTRNGDFFKKEGEYYLTTSNYKLVSKIEINTQNSEIKTQIYHPTTTSSIARDGCFFKFSEVEVYDEIIIPNKLELPNVDPINILIKIKLLLREDSNRHLEKIEIVNRMLDVLIDDAMHSYYIRRSFSQFDLEKYQLKNSLISSDQLSFIYSTNWVRTFRKYIKQLYI